ncbi:MAG: hypothetical protein JWM68_2921 [Verrucomicrobiales bacterium]|nr:hypothetical protein [Verrucomicrobiales bacterium]
MDYIIEVAPPPVCPYCQQGNLELLAETKSHVQEDIVLEPRTVVTKFEHRQAYCACCKRNVSATGPGEMPGSYIGPVAKSTATYLRYTLGVSFRNITRLFEEFFGLKFVATSALGFDKQATRRGEPLWSDVGNKVRASGVVHADETSWRHDGQGHWVWYGGNEDLAYFQFVQSRSKEAAQGLLGNKFDGILVADGYASYNSVNPMDRQSCLAHLKRKACELEKTISLLPKPLQDPAARSFCRKVAELAGRACHAGRLHREGQLSDKEALIEEKAFRAELTRWSKRPFEFPLAETFRKRLAGPEQKLFFTFLRHKGVEPTNNQAERSLRPIVIMRKILLGTRGQIGLENHSVLHTLIQTARRQNTPPRPFLETLLTSSTSFSQSALYNNDS